MTSSNFTPDQLAQLSAPLDPRRVAHRSGGGGTKLSYIEAHDAITTANAIFGYGAWGYDTLSVEYVRLESGKGFYKAMVRLHVDGGVPITEVGTTAVPSDTPDGHDMGYKGAVSDALKRALRCYGDQFGNGLYDKDAPAPTPSQGQPRSTATNSNANPTNSSNNRPATPAPRQSAQEGPPAPAPARPVQSTARTLNPASQALAEELAKDDPFTASVLEIFGQPQPIEDFETRVQEWASAMRAATTVEKLDAIGKTIRNSLPKGHRRHAELQGIYSAQMKTIKAVSQEEKAMA